MSNPLTKKELVVRLTDEKDLFFLYTLCIGEEDFQSLKVQQGLLVDFASFPQRFMNLLNSCLQDENKDSPKYVLQLTNNSSGSGERSTALLSVVETNSFKHLIHLSLKFMPGSDADIKKYLADCLKQLKETNGLLQQKLEHTTRELSEELYQTQESLKSKSAELESLKTEWNARITDMKARNKDELTSEKEKALLNQATFQQKLERDKRELELAHAKIIKQAEVRLNELDAANKELTDKKYKSESLIRDLKSKLSVLEEESTRVKQDATLTKKQNISVESDLHEKEKLVNQLQTRIAVLEQEVKDKEHVVTRTTDLYNSNLEAKKKIEEDLERRGKEVSKLEGKVKAMSDELKKGNEIIKKLQSEIKNYHSKVKLRTQIATEQERLLKEKDQELESLRQDLATTKETLKQKQDENKTLSSDLAMATNKLEECKKLLKSNETMIMFLNKQINEQQILSKRIGAFEMPPAMSIRQTSAGLHNFSTSSYGSAGSRGMDGVTRNGLHSGVVIPQVYPPPSRAPQVLYNPSQANPRKSALPVPAAIRNAPPPAIPEELHPLGSNHNYPVSAHSTSADKENNPPLDPKYFQKREDAIPVRGLVKQAHSPPPSSTSASAFHQSSRPDTYPPTSTHPPVTSSVPAYISSAAHIQMPSVRLSQQMIVPKTSQPPLASAYFPGQTKS